MPTLSDMFTIFNDISSTGCLFTASLKKKWEKIIDVNFHTFWRKLNCLVILCGNRHQDDDSKIMRLNKTAI